MLAELITTIQTLAEKAKTPTIQRITGTRKILAETKDGLQVMDLENDRPKPIHANLETVEALVETIQHFRPAAIEARKDWGLASDVKTSTIWLNFSGAFAFIDDLTRHDSASVPFNLTSQFKAIEKLQDIGQEFNQVDLLKFLKVCLFGTGADIYAPQFRELQWDRSNKGTGKANHADESMGRQVESKVVSGQDIPEQLKLTVPIFTNAGLTFVYPITVIVTMEFSRESIRLTTAPGDIQAARQYAIAETRKRLAGILEQLDGSIRVTSGEVKS